MIRSDQILELEKIQESLVTVLLREADPAEWVRDTTDNRKERLEQKRSATATLTLVIKISSVLSFMRGTGPAPAADPEGAEPATTQPSDAEIQAAAKEAATLLATYNNGKRKA